MQKADIYHTRRSGFTLVETIVSLAILIIFFSAVTVIFNIVTRMIGESRVRAVGVSLATQKMEEIRNLPFESVGTQGGIPPGVLEQEESVEINSQTFLIRTTVVYIDDAFDGVVPTDLLPTDYKRVRVTVDWEGPFRPANPITLLTNVVPNGIESVVGGGTLFVSVINSLGEPVNDAQVRIVNTQVNPQIDLSINSNSSGTVLLPGAPVCNDCYQITVSKSGYTTERTYSVAEVANPLKPHGTVIEAQLTSLTFSLDQAAVLQIHTTGSRQSNYPSLAGVQFHLKGTKIIGYNASDQPVFKYDRAFSSGPGGRLTISDADPDTYEVTIPNPSSVDLAGTNPISPFPLTPGSTTSLRIVTTAATAHNLLVTIQNTADTPVATASATLSRSGFIATQSAGLADRGDFGQAFFSNLTAGTYSLTITHPDFKTATGSATVNQDSIKPMVIEPR